MSLQKIYQNQVLIPCTKDKRPIIEKWQEKTEIAHTLPNDAEMIGMRLGKIDETHYSYVVIDIDKLKEKDTERGIKDAFELHNWRDIDTFTVQTRSGGLHLYFEYDDDFKKKSIKHKGYTLDLLTNGCYIIIPPSKGYTVIRDVPIAKIPKWFKTWFFETNEKKTKEKKQQITTTTTLSKNDDDDKIINDLSKILDTKVSVAVTSEGTTIYSSDRCFVEKECNHATPNHSCIFYNESKKTMIANCFSHGKKKLNSELVKKIIRVINSSQQSNDVEHHDYLDVEYLLNLDGYETKKKYFEQYVFMVEHPQQIFVRQTKSDFTYYHNTKTIKDAFIETSEFITEWLQDPKKRKYYKIDFMPNNNDPHIFNTFTGFAVADITPSYDKKDINNLIKPFIEHINIMTNNHAQATEHLLNWIAQIFQQPHENTRTAILIRGDQGCGKGALCDTLFEMIGKNFCFISGDPSAFFDKHSEALWNKILVVPDEAKGKDTFDQSDKMKSWISATTLQVNPKNIRPLDIHNCARFIFLSNNLTPLKVEQSDRRYIVLEASSCVANKKKYFDKYYEHMKDKQRIRAFYDFLMSRDISKVDWVNDRPKTEAYEDLKQVESHLRFLAEYEEQLFNHDETVCIPAIQFLNKYVEWRELNRYKEDNMNSQLFGRLMARVNGIVGAHKKQGKVYELNRNEIHKYLVKLNVIVEQKPLMNLFLKDDNDDDDESDDESDDEDDDDSDDDNDQRKELNDNAKTELQEGLKDYFRVLVNEAKSNKFRITV